MRRKNTQLKAHLQPLPEGTGKISALRPLKILLSKALSFGKDLG
jgi:hypothetical protein